MLKLTPADTNRSTLKILVADDEPSIVSVLKFFLEREGFLVITCSDGTEAIAKVKTEKPDLIILDGNMPIMNGPEAAEEILRHCITPIIFYSSSLETKDEAPAGCLFVLKDGSGLSELVKKVEQLLGGRHDGNNGAEKKDPRRR